MSKGSRKRSPAKPSPTRQEARAEKRAQFTETRSSRLPLVVALAVVAVAAVAAVVVVASRGGGEAAAPAAATQGGAVRIPLADLADGKAHFYSYDGAGTPIKYFVVKSADGVYRAAFDACDVCYPNKKGYQQEGDEMVCNNCGRRFPSNQINLAKGGCNPSPLERTVDGTDLVITTTKLDAGERYF